MNFLKVVFGIFIIIILNGCAQSTAFLGPGITLATSGNAFNAGLQLATNSAFKKETGKDALTYVKDVVEEDQKKRKFHKEFKAMVEKRVKVARKQIIIN